MNYELWDKVGRGVGNLKSLDRLYIRLINFNEGDVSERDWEILARILRHVSHGIKLYIRSGNIAGPEEMRAFARAIQGNPAITRFDTSNGSVRFESTDILCSALASLPYLEYVFLQHLPLDREEVPELGRPESMAELLRVSSLRSIEFRHFCFTDALCQATANALKEGAAITSLAFHGCSFPDGKSEKIASALKRNATLTTFTIWSDSINEAVYDAMTTSLLSNSTLEQLTIFNYGHIEPSGVWVSSLLLALGMNKTLKNLDIFGVDFAGDLCPALQDGLGKNSTLERLELRDVSLAEAGVSYLSFYFAAIKAVQPNKTPKTLYLCNFSP
jgi:hypothetical protein